MIYFFLIPYRTPEKANYQQPLIALGEGLRALGIPYASNVEYYFDGQQYLFEAAAFDPDKYTVVIVSPFSLLSNKGGFDNTILDILKRKNRRYTTANLDWSDGFNSYYGALRHLTDHYFVNDYVEDFHNDANTHPLSYFLTNRMIQMTTLYALPWENRRRNVFVSWRTAHQLRKLSSSYAPTHLVCQYHDQFQPGNLTEWDQLMWNQTGRRHNPDYYREMGRQQISDAVGGWLKRVGLWRRRTIGVNLDSFRLWESFAMGCAVVCADFQYYRITLPFQPVPGEHYYGLRFSDKGAQAYRAFLAEADSNTLRAMANAGREWALEHYCPTSLTRYFCTRIGLSGPV